MSATLDKAKKEGRVLVYGTVEPNEFEGWAAAFEKKYPGIKVEFQRRYVPGTPPPMAKAIMDESAAGKETADVVIVAVPPLLQFKGLGLLAKAKLKEASAYKEAVRQSEGYWFPLVSIPMVQAYNPQTVAKKDLPKTAMDLTDAKWRAAIVSHDLTVGTLGAFWVASMRPVFGEAKYQQFVEGLAANQVKLYPLYDSVVDSVTSDETKIALTVLLHDFLKAKKAKRSIERLKLKDVPLMMTYNAIAKTTRGSHPAAADLLIDFLLSKAGQKLVGSTYLRIPVRKGTGAPYSLEKFIGAEKFKLYPNKEMAATQADSIASLARLFKKP